MGCLCNGVGGLEAIVPQLIAFRRIAFHQTANRAVGKLGD